MLERNIEAYLRDKASGAGGRAYKFVSPANSGVPDRIVMLPGGRIAFVELKAPGKKATPLQVNQQRFITRMGLPVFTIDNKKDVDELIQHMQAQGGMPLWPEQEQ